MKYTTVTILAIITCCCLTVAAKDTIHFPGVEEVSSPDGKYIVKNQDRENERPNHVLFWVDTTRATEQLLLEYDRNVEVLWAPDSTRIIINDHQGSDESTCYIFNVRSEDRTDIKKRLLEEHRLTRHITENHHVYISCEDWVTEEIVSISASGYGNLDPAGFDIRVDYDLDSDVVSMSYKE